MPIERMTVIGAGLMGSGIAQTVAQAGFDTTLVDLSESQLGDAKASIERSFTRMVKSGRATEEAATAAKKRIHFSTDLVSAGTQADHVIEAVSEDLGLKQDIFRRLDDICRDDVIFATNTSQFSVTQLASATKRPDRVIGTHWFNPAPIMRLVEVIRGHHTSDSTLETVLDLVGKYGKEAIVCKKDTQGFITSRLILLLNLEATRILEEGIADVEDINKACVLAFNHAMGPLDTLDLSGLDTALYSAEAMARHYGERFIPPQTLRRLVNAGDLGRKSGRGFRGYGDEA